MGISSQKEKIKASDLGKVLLVFVDVFNSQNYEQIKDTIDNIQKESCLPISQLLFEYCCLIIFTVDFAVYQELGNTDKKNEILDSFYESIEAWSKENASRYPHMYDEIQLRLSDYTSSLKNAASDIVDKLGPGWLLGKVFAKYCKIENDPAKTKIAMIGGTIFTEYLLTIINMLCSYRLV